MKGGVAMLVAATLRAARGLSARGGPAAPGAPLQIRLLALTGRDAG